MPELPFIIIDKIDIGIMVVDQQLNITLWNSWLERYTGQYREETLGQSILEVCPRFREKRYKEILLNALHYGQSRFCSSSLHKSFISSLDSSKTMNQQNMQVEPIYKEKERLILIQISDVTSYQSRVNQLKNVLREIEIENEQIKIAEGINRQRALHDPLTGVPNRFLLYDRMAHEIECAHRRGNMVALMFLDMDGFKIINDTYGHDAGDKLLREFAARITGCIRQSDTVARLGGDEFIVILPDINCRDDIMQIANKIHSHCEKSYYLDDIELAITVSIGISLYPDDGIDVDTLIKKADSAMYIVKASGKNNIAFYK